MRSRRLLASAALASLASLAILSGCDKARPLPAPADPSRGCTSCHGGQDNSTGAPPWSLPRNAAGDIVSGGNQVDGAAATTHVEVGAHSRHVSRGVSCGACHVVPTQISSPGHNTGKRATVTFKELAAAGNVIPSAWNADPGAASHTCSNYCHGSPPFSAGGSNHAPDWLRPADGACGTCHGQGTSGNPLPPAGAGHPQVDGAGQPIPITGCIACHPGTVNADGTINVAGGKHVNGVLDGGSGHPAGWADPASHGPAATAGLQNCAACHGADFSGGTSGVSCNACHATAGHPSWQTECTFCHGDPARTADAAFPEVGTGAVVRANLASPPVGSQGENAISAYAVGAHQAHVSPTRYADAMPCAECHGPALPADTAHVGGQVLLGWGPVAAAHGTPLAPPAGETNRWNDATLPANGANCTNYCHGATLGGGTRPSPKWNEGPSGASCGSCHALPPAASAGHVQRGDCATCHPGYPSSPVAASTITGAALATHVDGTAQVVPLSCTTCHGGANPAPPVDTTGASTGVKVGAHQRHLATTLSAAAITCDECHPTVSSTGHADGAVNVSWNLGATVWAGATFPAVTPAAGPLPAGWEATPTCTNYCHGGFTNGRAATVDWTSTIAMTCNSCHGAGTGAAATLPGGTHPQGNSTCSACHTGYTATTVNGAAHLNGQYDVSASSCTACHGAKGAYTPIPGADGLAPVAPPTAADGTNTLIRVGAHQAHVNQATYRASPLACSACHPIPNTHGGTRDAAWSALATNTIVNGTPVTMAPTPAAATGYTTTWEATPTCTNACHGGNIPSNASRPAPSWTAAGGLACTSCHGAPPPLSATANQSHPQNTACDDCHGAGYGAAAVNRPTHIDGTLDRITSGCTACHGDRADPAVTLTTSTFKAAPGATSAPTSTDTTGAGATTDPGVGAHRAHLVGSGGTPRWRSAAIACTECHALPAIDSDTTHATGVGTGGALASLSWGPLATDSEFETKTPGYAQPTCSSVYCHDPKGTDTAATATTPAWTGATAVAACGSCHGLPPAGTGHPADASCSGCHPGYADAPGAASTIAAVNALSHINGQLDGGGDCTGCHATTQSMAAGGTRRAIVPEFALAWSHKRSGGGTVTKFDCAVCHMEGDTASGDTTAVHRDGVINLRDPDTGANIKGVTFSGTGAGAYASTATDMTFVEFSRNLSSATLEPAVQAIMVNQCLKCHDGNGALSASARVPSTGTAEKPFGTTISGAAYAGAGVTANGVPGGVTDVSASFAPANSSYHPVTARQNNWYAKLTRMAAPWNAAARGATVDITSWGPLLSCWDCHAGTGATGILTATVTAHGGAVTLRGNATAPTTARAAATTNEATLCKICHAGYDASTGPNHGTGSAFPSNGSGNMVFYTRWGCNKCHGSNYTTAVVRPVRAQDVHGVDSLPANGTKISRWSTDPRPYAFIRNTTALSNHQPGRIGATAYSPNCVHLADTDCNSRTETYSPGGTY